MSERRNILYFAVVFWVTSVQSQPADEIGFIFLPFKNHTQFRGKWELRADVPRYLSAYTNARFGIRTVSPIVVLDYLHRQNLPDDRVDDVTIWKPLEEQFGLRFIVAGSIEEFDVSRFMTGEPMLAGYEAFKGEIKISYVVYDVSPQGFTAEAREVAHGEASGEFTDRSLALTLFGKPTLRTIQYRELDKITFGSEDFNRTVIGQACLHMSEQFCMNLEEQLPRLTSKSPVHPDTLKLASEISDSSVISFKARSVTGQIVFLDGDGAFVNLGNGDGVQKGMVAAVYSQKEPGKKVGEIEITDVRAEHFSFVKIKSGKEAIQVKDLVKLRILE